MSNVLQLLLPYCLLYEAVKCYNKRIGRQIENGRPMPILGAAGKTGAGRSRAVSGMSQQNEMMRITYVLHLVAYV